MRALRCETVIGAPPERVWKELTDFGSYPSWNPFIRRASGRLAPGERLEISLALGRRNVRFRPVVTVVDAPRELRWRATQVVPGLFDVDRCFSLSPNGADACLFVQSEAARGLLAPVLVPLVRRQILAGYRAMNAALQQRVSPAGAHETPSHEAGDPR
jgi:hypothetical protein